MYETHKYSLWAKFYNIKAGGTYNKHYTFKG
jgi:hypothetical protein